MDDNLIAHNRFTGWASLLCTIRNRDRLHMKYFVCKKMLDALSFDNPIHISEWYKLSGIKDDDKFAECADFLSKGHYVVADKTTQTIDLASLSSAKQYRSDFMGKLFTWVLSIITCVAAVVTLLISLINLS